MTNFASASDKDKFRQILKEFLSVLLFVLLLLAGAAFLMNLHLPSVQKYGCDMEKVVQWKNKPHFVSNGNYFANGQIQSNEQAYSGNFSAKTNNQTPYALSHKHPNLTGHELITITAWRYSKNKKIGSIVISVPNKILWKSEATIIEKKTNGWEKIQLTQAIPMDAKNKTLTIYLWNTSKEIVYFDDLAIKIEQKEIL